MTKTKQENDMTDYIGMVYTKIEIQLSRTIELSGLCY